MNAPDPFTVHGLILWSAFWLIFGVPIIIIGIVWVVIGYPLYVFVLRRIFPKLPSLEPKQ